jgi:DNA-binding FrmR family transcriptional regulator
MDKKSTQQTRADLIKRLKRIEGQVKGLQRMLQEEKCCADILVQVAAVRAAINKVGVLIFEEHSRSCLQDALKNEDQQALENMIEVLNRFIK